jgi:hypothetical protein
VSPKTPEPLDYVSHLPMLKALYGTVWQKCRVRFTHLKVALAKRPDKISKGGRIWLKNIKFNKLTKLLWLAIRLDF